MTNLEFLDDMQLKDLIEHITHGEGFNWLTSHCDDCIRRNDYRRVLMEVLYAVESDRILLTVDKEAIREEFNDNIRDYYEYLFEEDDE